jgi:hypothetical protein
MPTIKIEVKFDLSDYFGWSGFCAGADGIAMAVGFDRLDLAVTILNQEMEKAGLAGWKASSSCCGRFNPCQVKVADGAGEQVPLDVVGSGVVLGTRPSRRQVREQEKDAFVRKVWPSAYARFESEAPGPAPVE